VELLVCSIADRLRARNEETRRRFRMEQQYDPGPLWIDDAWEVIWRLRAQVPLAPVIFTSAFAPRGPGIAGGNDGGGQYWADYMWSDGATVVALGTEDDEGLGQRAARGDGLPPRLAKELDSGDTILYRQEGLGVRIPPLEAGEVCQIHFGCAWGPAHIRGGEFGEIDNADPLLQTDVDAHDILESAGLT
jgi:hypothetical protein